jgi:hypothetical protein
MKRELDESLVKDFPLLFSDRHGNMQATAMCWGFECGDGWESIIRAAAEKLEPLIREYRATHPDDEFVPRASQIKEKYGTLRFYLSSGTDEMFEIANEAESRSETVCEVCGQAGRLLGRGWLVTRCSLHEPKE